MGLVVEELARGIGLEAARAAKATAAIAKLACFIFETC